MTDGDDQQKPRTLGPGWDHLGLRDERTEEEKREAEAKEYRRRRGSTRDWWKQDRPEGE